MRSKGFLRALSMFAIAALVLLTATSAWSAGYKVLYNFGTPSNTPSSGLVTDAAGNAYGVTSAGGLSGVGTVYELSLKTGYHLLYSFHKNSGGFAPQGNLVFDSAGNLYGTTTRGGIENAVCTIGCGVVFELSPPLNGGSWTETVLYAFCSQVNCADGAYPQAGVIFDSTGNLFGTTENGGGPDCPSGCGTVFELQPSQSGWTESVLYAFVGAGVDGANPLGSLVFDGSGSVYGTTSTEGPGAGSAFRLSPSGGGWIFSLIYAFEESSNQDGNNPYAGMIFDPAGNLYGTTSGGGQFGFGTVFELSPGLDSWTETILYSFAGGTDGAKPEASVALDGSGKLYGTTFAGGCTKARCGTVFRLTPSQGGQWTESLFRFPLPGTLGLEPTAPVILDAAGRVYGTTTTGGQANRGVAFKITQ
jgi:uncharacterized repeat protein (TIGR03803 family)